MYFGGELGKKIPDIEIGKLFYYSINIITVFQPAESLKSRASQAISCLTFYFYQFDLQ